MTIRTALIAGAAALTPLAAQAEWRESIQIDRITGERLHAGIESVAFAEEPRPAPVGAFPGWLYLDCATAGVMFTLIDMRPGQTDLVAPVEFSDLDELPIRARVDDHVAEFQAEIWRMDDTPALMFSGTGLDSLYLAIIHAGNLLLEIPTVEYGDLYFSFSLAGTRKLHDRTCGTTQSD